MFSITRFASFDRYPYGRRRIRRTQQDGACQRILGRSYLGEEKRVADTRVHTCEIRRSRAICDHARGQPRVSRDETAVTGDHSGLPLLTRDSSATDVTGWRRSSCPWRSLFLGRDTRQVPSRNICSTLLSANSAEYLGRRFEFTFV